MKLTPLKSWLMPSLVALCAHVAIAALPVAMSAATTPKRPDSVRISLPPPPEPEPETPPEPEPPAETPPPEQPPEPPPPPPQRPKPRAKAQPITQNSITEAPSPIAAATQEVVQDTPEPLPAPEPPPTRVEPPVAPSTLAPTPPPAPAQPPSPNLGPYRKGLHKKLMAHKRYPRIATEMGMEGVALVRLVVDREGRLIGEPTLLQSTGHPILDKEVLRLIHAASPFERLPQGVAHDQMSFEVPIRFRLKD